MKSTDELIDKIMQLLEKHWYVDTDWRDEETFDQDYRPMIDKMINDFLEANK